MESSRSKRRRLIMELSYVSPRQRPDLPACFESLNDDTLTTVLEFVGGKSYRSFGGVNKHCKEIYLATKGMTKETFLFGYGPLSVITDRIESAGYQIDWRVRMALSKGVVFYNRLDVLDWALQHQKKYVLSRICYVSAGEGRINLLEEVLSYMNDRDDKRDVFGFVDYHAAYSGKLNVLKWLETKGLSFNKDWCAEIAARFGHLHILEWLREERGLELFGTLYNSAALGDHLHVLKWLRENKVDWYKRTFRTAAEEGNLDILQWLHDKDCPWPDDYRVSERGLKPEVIDWCEANGHGDRIRFFGSNQNV